MLPSQDLVFHHHHDHRARHAEAAAFNHPTRPTAFVGIPSPPESPAVTTDATMEATETTAAATNVATADDDNPAMILYPTGRPTINNIDTVQVTYDTIWENANLTLFCGIDEAENKWALANIPLPEPSGTCIISPIQAGMDISQFPVSCGMLIYDSSDQSESTTGGAFVMTKTEGVVSAFGPSLTTTATTSPQTTNAKDASTKTLTNASDDMGDKSGGQHSQTATTWSSSSTATNAGGVSSGSDSNTTPDSTDGGLSSGTKAGLAIGVILGAIALFLAIFFFFRLRRRIDRVEKKVTTEKEVLPPPSSRSSPSKGEKTAPPILPSPRFTVGSNSPAVFTPGGGTTTTTTNHHNKNSEDWRQFFGNAATVSGSNPRSHTSLSA